MALEAVSFQQISRILEVTDALGEDVHTASGWECHAQQIGRGLQALEREQLAERTSRRFPHRRREHVNAIDITEDLADLIMKELDPKGVGVVLEATHATVNVVNDSRERFGSSLASIADHSLSCADCRADEREESP